MEPTSTSTTPPTATDSAAVPALSPEYQAYRDAMQRLKAIEAQRDFSPEGEKRYTQAVEDALSLYRKLVDYEQGVMVRK